MDGVDVFFYSLMGVFVLFWAWAIPKVVKAHTEFIDAWREEDRKRAAYEEEMKIS